MNIFKGVFLCLSTISFIFAVRLTPCPRINVNSSLELFTNRRKTDPSFEEWGKVPTLAEKEQKSSDISNLIPSDVVGMITAFLPLKDLAAFRGVFEKSIPPQMIEIRRILREKFSDIIPPLLLTQTPIHQVLEANGFDVSILMYAIGIKEDTYGRMLSGQYEQSDRKLIVDKLSAYAEKKVITAADIADGKDVQHGDVVVLSYSDMVTHKAVLDYKDIDLCVDVFADANGQLVWSGANLPKGFKKLYFHNTQQDITRIGHGFLFECIHLTSLDLSGFKNVTSVGNDFLYGCRFEKLDLSAIRNVKYIGDFFLFGNRLTIVDLSVLTNLITIGSRFLMASELTSIDLSGFTDVTNIGGSFLSGCRALSHAIIKKGMTIVRDAIPATVAITEID